MARPLPAFVCLVYTLSAGLSLVVWLTGGHQSSLAFPLGVGAMFVPALATLVVVSTTDTAGPTLRWNSVPVSYLPIALLLIPLVMHAAMLPVAAPVWGGLPWASWLTPDAAGLYHTPAALNGGVLTALHCAAKAGFINVVKALIEHGGDVNAINERGQTPLDEVEDAGRSIDRESMRRLLVSHGGRRSKL